MTRNDDVYEDPRFPVDIRKSLREAQEKMDDYSKLGVGKARPGSEELAYHIQHMKQELQKSLRFHIRGIRMTPPVPVEPLLI